MELFRVQYFSQMSGVTEWVTEQTGHAEILVVVNGNLHVSAESQELIASAGDVIVVPGDITHWKRADKDDPPEFTRIMFSGGDDLAFRLYHDYDGKLRMLAQWIHRYRHLVGNPKLQNLYFEAMLEELDMLDVHSQGMDLVWMARDLMWTHLAEPLTLEQLAEGLGYTKYYFARTYKSLAGTAPMEEYRGFRIEQAKHLLRTTRLPLKTIAPMVGFTDQYHLGRVFKKVAGITPGAFRKAADPPGWAAS